MNSLIQVRVTYLDGTVRNIEIEQDHLAELVVPTLSPAEEEAQAAAAEAAAAAEQAPVQQEPAAQDGTQVQGDQAAA